jgi:hypothetical protein
MQEQIRLRSFSCVYLCANKSPTDDVISHWIPERETVVNKLAELLRHTPPVRFAM